MIKNDESSEIKCEALKEAVHGSNEAFARFCSESMPMLLRIQQDRCRKFGIPPDLARDFVQESLLKAVNWLRMHPGMEIPHHWLSKVSRNVVFDWLRKRRPQSNRGELLASIPAKEDIDSDFSVVSDAYELLGENDKKILRLILLDGISTTEAARQLNINTWSVYKRYERALLRLSKLLE